MIKEKIFANHESNKGAVSRIYIIHSSVTTDNPIIIMDKDMNRHCIQEDMCCQWICENLFNITSCQEIQIKTIMRQHCMDTRNAKIKTTVLVTKDAE